MIKVSVLQCKCKHKRRRKNDNKNVADFCETDYTEVKAANEHELELEKNVCVLTPK